MAMNGVPRPGLELAPFHPFTAEGRRVLVVGGTGGLGRALARFYAAHGARVTVVGRTFRDEGVAGLEFVAADLSSMRQAERVGALVPAEEIDLVILTNGIITAPQREVTEEGVERDLAVGYLSRFVLVRTLAERLGRNRPGRPRVFVMGFPGTDEAGDPDDLNAERAYRQWPQHMNTVAANEALVLDLARRYPRLGVFGLNPGLVATDIRANMLGGSESVRFRLVETVVGWFTPTPEGYAERIGPLLLAPGLEGETGLHLNKSGRPIQPSVTMTPERVAAFTAASERLLVDKGLSAPG